MGVVTKGTSREECSYVTLKLRPAATPTTRLPSASLDRLLVCAAVDLANPSRAPEKRSKAFIEEQGGKIIIRFYVINLKTSLGLSGGINSKARGLCRKHGAHFICSVAQCPLNLFGSTVPT